MDVVRISVRRLVEFILRSGDIDNRIAGSEKDAMQLGGRLHRKIQKQMGAGYRAEVPLTCEVPCDDFVICVEGRADGILETEDGTVIDEIKGIFKDLETLTEPVPVHLAQARCYAYIYASQNDLSEIGVQMTYCNMDTEELKRFQYVYKLADLDVWFTDLIDQYKKWARYQVQWRKKRNASIKEVEFPFEYREGQRELVTSVYKTILRKKRLFIQAPTGVGKTIATVFPAVKALGEGLGEKIFYLTAKTITRTVAWQAFDSLKDQALRMKVLVLTAKEKICFMDEANCNPKDCPYAKGHFDRVNDAVYELLVSSDEMSREIMEEQAREWQVCPYEMSLDLSDWADAVICDYNYVFDPNAHLRRFFGEGTKGDYLFLIDEAHNLVERGQKMYSATLCKEDFLQMKKSLKGVDEKLTERLSDCNRQLLALKRECEDFQVLDSVGNVYLKLLGLMTELERFLEESRNDELRQDVLNFYFDVRRFVSVYEGLDEHYLIYSELDSSGHFLLHLFCVNPAQNLQEFLDKGNSTIFFSATLLPIQYYKQLLSMDKDDYAIYAESPFDTRKRLLLLGTDVSTKYTRRNEDMYQKYARYLLKIAGTKKGNYIAYFPSYKFMSEVYEAFLGLLEEAGIGTEAGAGADAAIEAGADADTCTGSGAMADIEYVMQSQYMSEESREIFLENFEEERDGSLVGFCVMGGIFAEGIDLDREKLIGAIIIGTGLPQVCREREMLKDYFDAHGLRGFDYAYLYPGMNKVQQSAGRVIRTDEDEGVILLLDERFQDSRYQEVFPREWRDFQLCTEENVQQKIEQFWQDR